MNSISSSVALRTVAVLLILVFGPSISLQPGAPGIIRDGIWIALGGAVLAYLGALWSLTRGDAGHERAPPSCWTILLHFGAWFGLLLLLIICLQSDLLGRNVSVISPRRLLLLLGWALAALLISHWPPLSSRLTSAALSVAAAVVATVHFAPALVHRPAQPPAAAVADSPVVSYVDSSLYQLKLTEYLEAVPRETRWRRGGGLAQFGSLTLLATGDGAMYVLDVQTGQGLYSRRRLPYQVPLNMSTFEADAKKILADLPGEPFEPERFRVTGVLVQETVSGLRVLVSHHYWNSDQSCFTMRISMLEGARDEFEVEDALAWRTVYETKPCLTLNTADHGVRFEGNESGGKMIALDRDTILFSVGDHAFDGVLRPGALAQDPGADYGKILRVRIPDGTSGTYTIGHRNPQGLHRTDKGQIWSTEHGPRGGDELNRIVEGRNYGWPLVTYGTEYSRRSWPSNAEQGRHNGFERPVYASVPSVGISPLTSVQSSLFPLWNGDLLAGTLRSQQLIRFRIWDDHVVMAEPIPVERRIRDILVLPDGRLLLWTDYDSLITVEPSDSAEGRAVADLMCSGCHELRFSEIPSTELGPNLAGLVERPVATRSDFQYSPALKGLGGDWTAERLARFLQSPQQFAPGTKMAYPGVADEEQRRQLVEFLTDSVRNFD